jgi:hypothetical protein
VTLAEIKRAVQAGQIYDVTNHHIKREDHSCFGTTRRRVAKTTGSSVYLAPAGTTGVPQWPSFAWPKASQVQMDQDGTIRLYGGGCGQKPDDLFLTLVPVAEAAGQ